MIGARLFGPNHRPTGDVHKHDRQALLAKGRRHRADTLNHTLNGMHRRQRNNTLLEINNDQGGLGIEGGYGHGRFFLFKR